MAGMQMDMDILKKEIDLLLTRKEQVLIAIDGSCTAGKTTLAGKLTQMYDCNVFHMDDFFLRPVQRTAERLAEVGGNVDYERFRAEVLLPLREGKAFTYRPYNCKVCALAEPVAVKPKQLNIIEGTYSLHPHFGDPYDLKVFMTVLEDLQRLRIQERPAHLHQRFWEEWIPMEYRYFEGFRISDRCDIVI